MQLDAVIVTGTSSQAGNEHTARAVSAAHGSNTLADLEERYASESRAHSEDAHGRIVFGDGPDTATLMCIGGFPGDIDAQTGVSYSGPEGDLLTKMLKPMGFARQDVYLTNVLKAAPSENHSPAPEDVEYCGIWLHRQIELVQPSVIVALGGLAANFLLHASEDMSTLRGKWGSFSSSHGTIPVMPTYHPTFVLEEYTQEVRGVVWGDLQQVMEKLKEVSGQI
jgi:DNA polymerase